MINQTLLIYDFETLFQILYEIQSEIKFNINKISKTDLDKLLKNSNLNNIVISKVEIPDLKNHLLIKSLPIKLSKLIEEINIKFLKIKFGEQSEIEINKYVIDINSREVKLNNFNLKLTEKECDIILYLNNSNRPVSINELQFSVWGYNSNLETHTVETHIYRLRKKILQKFDDANFIKSSNKGYFIN